MKAEAEAVTVERSASDVRRDVRAIFDEQSTSDERRDVRTISDERSPMSDDVLWTDLR